MYKVLLLKNLGAIYVKGLLREIFENSVRLIKKITQTAVMNIVFQCIFIELDVSYASQHTFSKVTVTIFKTYIYIYIS